jgi:hypothetical protein
MKSVDRLLKLSAAELIVLIQAFGLLAAVRLSLWTVSFGTCRSGWALVLERVSKSPGVPSLPPQRIVWLTSVASRYVPGAHCLARCIAAQILLARQGYRAEMKIGVRKEGASLDAHAWLELGGAPLFESAAHLNRFTCLPDRQVLLKAATFRR